jgi:hypothetical protein
VSKVQTPFNLCNQKEMGAMRQRKPFKKQSHVGHAGVGITMHPQEKQGCNHKQEFMLPNANESDRL